jgi:hypothetical protein
VEYVANSQFTGTDTCTKTQLVPATHIKRTPTIGTILYDEYSTFRKIRPYLSIECDFPPIYARHIDQPILTNEFIVHKGNTIYVDSSIHSATSNGRRQNQIMEGFSTALRQSEGTVDQRYADESAMVLHNEGGGTWGHFIVQNLPRALLYLANFPDGKIVLPRDHAFSEASNFCLSLRRLGVPQERLLPVDRVGRYQFRELILVDFLYDFPKQVPHPLALDLLAAPLGAPTTPRDAGALFLQRIPETRRCIENVSDLEGVLSKHGVRGLMHGKQHFSGQVEAWQGSDLIVATLGSDLTNIVFGKEGTRILALSPDWFEDSFFYNLAIMKGMQWNELRCGGCVDRGSVTNGSSLRIDPEIVDVMLSTLAR